ncbi:MAG: hypothetical protein ACLQHF_14110, partial [Terracidiphilus sp.]
MRQLSLTAAALLLVSCCLTHAQRIEVTIPATAPLHGRLILVFAKDGSPEPRMLMGETYTSAQAFGVDADSVAPGQPLVVDAKTFGYPRRSLADIEAGDYQDGLQYTFLKRWTFLVDEGPAWIHVESLGRALIV